MPNRKRLDLKEKENLINEASKPGFDRKKACAKYGIANSTLSGILKQKDSIPFLIRQFMPYHQK